MAIITASGSYSDFVTTTHSIGELRSVYYFVNTINPAFQACVLVALSHDGTYQTRFSLGYGDPNAPTTSQILIDFPHALATQNPLAIQ